MSLSEHYDGAVIPPSEQGVSWTGPECTKPTGGITFSMLSKFLSCRERFRVSYVEGLRPHRQFNHRISYGNMWHVCEEALAAGNGPGQGDSDKGWLYDLFCYTRDLCQQYPLSQDQIVHWHNVCKTQFPIYVDYWSAHPDVVNRTPLLQEQVFDVSYKLPSGRTVRLRGKFDSVDLINGAIYLQENKTKGDVDEKELRRQLTMDMQCMMYLVALHHSTGKVTNVEQDTQSLRKKLLPLIGKKPIVAGVRYNVVRRPLSGGKGMIVRHKPSKSNPRGESESEFYTRVGQYMKDDPNHFFMRWTAEVSPTDVQRFETRFLKPILEQLCDWYQWVSCAQRAKVSPFNPDDGTDRIIDGEFKGPIHSNVHYQHPYGAQNSIDEYGWGDLDNYMDTGSRVGLEYRERLFEELQ